jgi:GT2 family glycosyltransferase
MRMATDKDKRIRKAENEPVSVQGGVHTKDSPTGESESGPIKIPGTIVEMKDQIQSAVAKSETARKELEESKAVICDLQLRLTTLSAELTKELERGEKAREQACKLANELIETGASLRLKNTRLGRIEDMTGWRLVQQVQAITDRLFPFGTWRREAYRRTISRLIKALAGGGDSVALSHNPREMRRGAPSPSKVFSAVIGRDQDQKSSREIVLQCFSPQPGEVCARRYLVHGWAAPSSEVVRVEILVDGEMGGEALLGCSVSKVEEGHPRCDDAQISGFFYLWDTSFIVEGEHTLIIRVEARSGIRKDFVIPVTVSQWSESPTYERWVRVNESTPGRLALMAKEATAFSYSPLISIVTAVRDTPEELFREAIASVRRQAYTNWELCLAVDNLCGSELTGLIETSSREDPRIKYIQLEKSLGTSGAANAALSLATGEFIAFMDSDELLSPDALYWNIQFLQNHRDADLIYSDEDKVDPSGSRRDPFFKPDWSPDLLLSNNYIGRFFVVRRQVVHEAGGFRSEYDSGRNYDLILRLTELTQNILHIPRILVHDRAGPSLSSPSAEGSLQADAEARLALSDYLNRNRIPARVEPGCTLGLWQVRYAILENPRVGIVIPTGGRMELLQPCLESLFSQTDYPQYEILLVDNSKGGQVEQYAKSLESCKVDLRYLDYRGKTFNFSALNNFAVGKTEAPLVLLLNDDVTIVNTQWLSAMVEHGQRRTVGAVGAKLLYPSGSIQHAGVLMGIFECTSHAFKHLPANSLHHFAFPQMIRNCSAVTAACMLTRRAAYLEVGGLDERNLAVAFQDVDYCLRLREAGYLIVYTPRAVLIHHESVTKEEKIPNMKEVRYMQKKWRHVIAHDPYYSPNLSRKVEDYSLRLE